MRARTRRGIAAVAVGLGLLVASGCQTGTWAGDAGATSVAIMGDSLVYQSEGDSSVVPTRMLTDELVAAGYRTHVSGWVGETIAAGHVDLWPQVADEPGLDIVVIALGTNDVNRAVPLEDSRAALQSWLTETADVGCVALIGLNEHAYAWQLDVHGPPFNAMLAEQAALAPNAIFVPWEPDLDIHGHDGDVHFPTPESQAQYRATLHGAVDQCAATLPPA
jgi:hypothetical protein